jgi:hypothetical protein
MDHRLLRKYLGSRHCGAVRFEIHAMTARHFFCRTCGIYPLHRKRATPDHFGINVSCLHDFDAADIPVRRTDGATMP